MINTDAGILHRHTHVIVTIRYTEHSDKIFKIFRYKTDKRFKDARVITKILQFF